jgi:hypothetical protein
VADPLRRRRLGVYYTPDSIALALTRWALAGGATRVLDPSCGDGRFVRAAGSELDMENGQNVVVGVDVDGVAIRTLRRDCPPGVRLHLRSFFDVPAAACPDGPFGAVVGNPPFVRHHWQEPELLARARERASEAGAALTGLADLWAYFTVHATQHLSLDGRLALVLPVAATQVDYAEAVFAFVRRNFARVELVVLQDRVFENAREQLVVLLASGRGGSTANVRTAVVASVADLLARLAGPVAKHGEEADAPDGVVLWKWHLVSRGARELWTELCAAPEAEPLGNCAKVRIGTVTGANNLFVRPADDPVLTSAGVRAHPVVASSRLLETPVWRNEDDDDAAMKRGGGRLLIIDGAVQPEGRLRTLLDDAENDNVHERHHCAGRKPWWALRDVEVPEAFLGYMGATPRRLVVNESGAVCTNAVHRIAWHQGSLHGAAVSSWSSLFRLGAELYGRHYGGGVLKIEPSAAKRLPVVPNDALGQALDQLDANLRRRPARGAGLADQLVALALGATARDLKRLAEAADALATVRRLRR